jgi:hypothetical protein
VWILETPCRNKTPILGSKRVSDLKSNFALFFFFKKKILRRLYGLSLLLEDSLPYHRSCYGVTFFFCSSGMHYHRSVTDLRCYLYNLFDRIYPHCPIASIHPAFCSNLEIIPWVISDERSSAMVTSVWPIHISLDVVHAWIQIRHPVMHWCDFWSVRMSPLLSCLTAKPEYQWKQNPCTRTRKDMDITSH